MSNSDKYSDMYAMPHHQSKKHPQMSLQSRAAQFSPFAALTGFESLIDDEAKYTNSKSDVELVWYDEDMAGYNYE